MQEKKNILTYEGLRKYEDELHDLKVVKRQEVAQKIKEAREQGDLSENAEYDAAKDEQRDIEARIEELENILKNAEVVVEEDAHALKLIVERDEQLVDVQSLQYRLVVGLRQDAENHIIEQVLLIDILLHQHIVQRLLAVLYRALAMSRRQVERRDPCRVGHRTLELERRSRAIRSLYYDLVVRHIGRHSVLTIMGKRFEKLSLGLVVVFLKIGSCLGSLKLTRHSPQTALHGIVKLLASSTDYLLKI